MLRMSDNPEARYPADRALEEDLGRWSVAHVKSRQDKAFAHDLARAEISYYLPLIEKRIRRRDNGKIRKSLMPLFAGYVAVALPRAEWERAYATRRVAQMIPVEEQEQFVQELEQVRRALESDMRVGLAPAFEPGQPVRVISGPLMGLEGEVVHAKGETHFIIRVQMFQQAVRVEVDEACLEA